MTVVANKQRFALLIWALVLVLTGSSLAQSPRHRKPLFNPRPDSSANSTADQEAEPNTSNYPQRPAFTPGNPSSQPSTPIPTATPTATQPAQPIQPGNAAQQLNQAAARPVAAPQGQPMIGPPVPIPPTPEQMPPGAPKITYQDGVLSVESVNSRLSDILNGIHSKTGIQFEGLQPGADRVAGKFGPAPADEVLTTLLRGSRYDYIIVGLPENPALVQRVILSPGANGTVAGVAGGPIGGNPQANVNEEDDNSEDPEAQPEPVQPAPMPVQPAMQPRTDSNTPKSTEQLLDELKKLQQQNQQRQPPSAPIKPNIPQ